jgi:hypothetical protein
MKIVVAHLSPDLDAIASVWIIKRFLPGWIDADVEFVPAGSRSEKVKNHPEFETQAILVVGKDEIIHVDTGLGPLDHHQTSDMHTSGAKRAWEFVCSQLELQSQPLREELQRAISRIVDIIVDYDHFQEVYWPDAAEDHQEFSLFGINEGLQYIKPGEDDYYVEFGRTCFDYILSYFENKVWAEEEMKKGVLFETKYGKALGLETINESVVKLAQKKGYTLVVRKDPRKGYVSIKTLPDNSKTTEIEGIDLTLAYEQLSKMDPEATWFLHVSKKMLLNGSVKNPKMKPTKLALADIIKVLKNLYG